MSICHTKIYFRHLKLEIAFPNSKNKKIEANNSTATEFIEPSMIHTTEEDLSFLIAHTLLTVRAVAYFGLWPLFLMAVSFATVIMVMATYIYLCLLHLKTPSSDVGTFAHFQLVLQISIGDSHSALVIFAEQKYDIQRFEVCFLWQ